MNNLLRGELRRQKKLFLAALCLLMIISGLLIYLQFRTAETYMENKINSLASIKEDTRMKLIKGEQNSYNDHIGELLSDLGILEIYYKSPDQYSQEIAKTWYYFYQEAYPDTEYCQSVLNQTSEEVLQEINLYESYEELDIPIPLNPELPRASYVVYQNDSRLNWTVLIILGFAALVGIRIFAPLFETGSIKVMYTMPFTKKSLNISMWISAIIISTFYLVLQYTFLFFGGLLFFGNETVLIMQNGIASSVTALSIKNLPFIVLLAILLVCISSWVSCICQNQADSILIVLGILVAMYFIFQKMTTFLQEFTWLWIFIVLSLCGLFQWLVWKKIQYSD